MTRHFVLLLTLLNGCAAQPVYQPVEVSVPVEVACKTTGIKPPDWPLRSVTPSAPLFDKVKTTLAEIELHKAYEAELTAQIKACE